MLSPATEIGNFCLFRFCNREDEAGGLFEVAKKSKRFLAPRKFINNWNFLGCGTENKRQLQGNCLPHKCGSLILFSVLNPQSESP